MTRTTDRMVTFRHPFVLDGFSREIEAGTYLVQTEEELMDTVLSSAWRRVSTVIRLRTPAGTQDVFIDPEQLSAALSRDVASADNASSENQHPKTTAPPAATTNRPRKSAPHNVRKT